MQTSIYLDECKPTNTINENIGRENCNLYGMIYPNAELEYDSYEKRDCPDNNARIRCKINYQSPDCVNYSDLNGQKECDKLKPIEGRYWNFKNKNVFDCPAGQGKALCESNANTFWMWIVGGSLLSLLFLIIIIAIIIWIIVTIYNRSRAPTVYKNY